MPLAILRMFCSRVKIITIKKQGARFCREQLADGGLATAAHTHQHDGLDSAIDDVRACFRTFGEDLHHVTRGVFCHAGVGLDGVGADVRSE